MTKKPAVSHYAQSVGNGEIDRGFGDYVTAKCVVLKRNHLDMS